MIGATQPPLRRRFWEKRRVVVKRTNKQRFSGRKFERLPDSTSSLVKMINKAMGLDERLVELAEKIDYRYQHLWAVYKGYRKLPLEPMINLCKVLNIDEGKAARLYLEQPEPTKSEYDRKKAS
jgi:hypothetical protein